MMEKNHKKPFLMNWILKTFNIVQSTVGESLYLQIVAKMPRNV